MKNLLILLFTVSATIANAQSNLYKNAGITTSGYTSTYTSPFRSSGYSSSSSSKKSITWNDVIRSVERNNRPIGEVSRISLTYSDWLNSVKAYKIDGKYYVIAEIKRGYDSQKYIFCNIPKRNWDRFANSMDATTSYGEKFHKYILDYVCYSMKLVLGSNAGVFSCEANCECEATPPKERLREQDDWRSRNL